MDLKLYEPESFVAKPITTQYSQKSRNSFCRRGLGLRIGGSRFVSYRQKHASVSVTPKLLTGIIINTNRHGYTIGRASDLQFTGRGFKLRGHHCWVALAPSYLADELNWTDEAESRHRLRSGSWPTGSHMAEYVFAEALVVLFLLLLSSLLLLTVLL